MEAASAARDIERLNVTELRALLLAQDAQLQEKDAQLLSATTQLREHDEQLREQDEQLRAARAEIAGFAEQLQARDKEIERLYLLITKFQRLQFGAKSEKYTLQIEQLQFWVEELETARAEIAAAAELVDVPIPAAPKARRVFPAHLPREIHTIAPSHDACPDCGGALKTLGEDVSEQLEMEPVRFKVIRHVRPKLACASCDTIVQAPAPSRPIERGIAGPGLLAHVLVAKYHDHLPLYRQEAMYAREQIELDRGQLAQWVGKAGILLEPLVHALQTHVFSADVVHGDDTPIPVLAPGNGKTKTGRLWTYVRDERPCAGTSAPAVWFTYTPDRKGEHPQQHLANFRGILQADGYAGFSKLYENGQVLEAACWAHVRRKFFDLYHANHSPMAAEALERIGALYAIEKQIRGRPPDERQAVRHERSRPLLDAMKSWMEETLHTLSQKSAAAGAIRYALKRWDALVRFCDDGRIEIDNNAAERALRCVALGRKNYLFAGSDTGGERAAAFYSLLGSAKLNGHNPEAYLRDVLSRIADYPITRIAELLPWNLPLEQCPETATNLDARNEPTTDDNASVKTASK